MPRAGETLIGSEFQLIPGGKGANQAVAASRLGGDAAMLGCVGDDPFGEVALASLGESGVNIDGIEVLENVPTGTATIVVDDGGENRIIIISGANGHVGFEKLKEKLNRLKDTKMLVLQFEIPIETNQQLIEWAAEKGIPVMLNPAPAAPINKRCLSKVDYLIVNETEAELLTGLEVNEIDTAFQAANRLLQQGVGTAIITLGGRGAVLITPSDSLYAPALPVDVMDTTAAGDTFVGAMAASLVSGEKMIEALSFAVCAGSLVVTRLGAQSSIPLRDEVLAYLDYIEPIQY
jgi:ribokinase